MSKGMIELSRWDRYGWERIYDAGQNFVWC
jgi:hypothetical protein